MLARLLIILISIITIFPMVYKLVGVIQRRFEKPIKEDKQEANKEKQN